MKELMRAYRELFSILLEESPFIVVAAFAVSMLAGVVVPIFVWVNGVVFDYAIYVASGEASFEMIVPYLGLFAVLMMIPSVTRLFMYGYIEPRSLLILRTTYKGKMLQKLKKMSYAHLENEHSMEIIDKAYNRTEYAARHLFPMYVRVTVSSFISSVGTLYLLFSVRWWLLLAALIPFGLEVLVQYKFHNNIYEELEHYWNKERQYGILGGMLRSREYIIENKLFGSSAFLIDTYRKRLRIRNREYEKYFFKALRQSFTRLSIIRFTQVGIGLSLFWLFIQNEISIGLLISLTLTVFSNLFSWDGLRGCTLIFTDGGLHANTFKYCSNYFALSEDEWGDDDDLPNRFDIEFENVRFAYPGTDREILKGVSFRINHGEKISIVGENGQGKTTVIKLMIGLFKPDSGTIKIGGKPLNQFSYKSKIKLFGPIFQDFVKYSMSLKDNVGIGDIDNINNESNISDAINKAKINPMTHNLSGGMNTLLGRDFEGGIDLSGGQWQRVALARAFMGDKPILIFDEPTSQLDPMAESQLYEEFATMAEGKTSIFITHRLGSTVITDRILVIQEGVVVQCGTHDDLMKQGGLYCTMFNAQKQWYAREEVDYDNKQ